VIATSGPSAVFTHFVLHVYADTGTDEGYKYMYCMADRHDIDALLRLPCGYMYLHFGKHEGLALLTSSAATESVVSCCQWLT
jgi:hypothetical protein